MKDTNLVEEKGVKAAVLRRGDFPSQPIGQRGVGAMVGLSLGGHAGGIFSKWAPEISDRGARS